MHQRLIEIPFLNLTIHSFGPMIVLGFLTALFLMRRLARRAGLSAEIITNAAMYSLIIGVIGARIFFVFHHFEQLRGNLLGAIAVWRGGLEFLGGVIPTVVFLFIYLHLRKQPIRRYLDIMAMGLMMGLAFGRLGCFLNGCCFGRPTDLPWAVRFPYDSFAYNSQINENPARGRTEPQLSLPKEEYFGFREEGKWYPKTFDQLTEKQKYEVTKGQYRCLPVHPTQLYASANAFVICAILYAFWRKTHQPPP
ncbi:MAG: prolipoprotein diacylglyceryl transferase, partial [Planctomycetota bacterium]